MDVSGSDFTGIMVSRFCHDGFRIVPETEAISFPPKRDRA
jgi:hypothetical protein